MEYFTEKEFLINNQHFAYKLRKLYVEDFRVFKQLADYIPFFVQTNDVSTLDIKYSNNYILNASKETENLVKFGADYLSKISCPFLLENLKLKSKQLKLRNDYDELCSYPQKIKMNNTMNLIYSNKLLLDNNHFFIISNLMSDFGKIGRTFNAIFSDITSSQTNWQRFQSLTKQEKKILKLLVEGFTNAQISDTLFISKHTVVVHRKNIYKKLEINSVIQLVKFAMALELL